MTPDRSESETGGRKAPERGLPRPREALRIWAELAGLWSLAVAYPLLMGSVSGVEGLTSVRADRFDVVAYAVLVLALVPTLGTAFELLVGLFGTGYRRATHAGLLGLMTGIFLLRALVDIGLTGKKGLLLALVGSGLVAFAYIRSRFLQNMAGILTIATPVVLVAFAVSGPASALFTPADSTRGQEAPRSSPPIVMVILDEFPLAALEQRPGEIDRARFPNFARLARRATWYSRARTESDSTVLALPALLTGRLPSSAETPPGLADHPDTLFSILDDSGYDVYGSEWITDLCPHDVCARTRGFTKRLTRLVTNGLTFERPIPLPGEKDLTLTAEARELVDPLTPQPERVDEFVQVLEDGTSDANVLHLMLPHTPWAYLPSGKLHNGPPILNEFSGPDETVRQGDQRMLLQTRFVDAAIGKIVAAMKAAGTWDESLFIVVADHGGRMEPGLSRRVATRNNSGWILPVPLFVKYPDQPSGRIVRTTVPTTDIVPTVLAQLGLEHQGDGQPLDDDRTSPRTLRVHTTLNGNFTVRESRVRNEFRRAVSYLSKQFPHSSLYATGGHPELLGRKASTRRRLEPVEAELDSPLLYEQVDPAAEPVPAYVSGSLTGSEPGRGRPLAIGLNGTIAGTVRPWEMDGVEVFGTVVDPRYFRPGRNRVELFRITG